MTKLDELEVKVDKAVSDVDQLEDKLTSFAQDLGKVQGKLEAVDKRVEHNCQRNEENFATLNTSLLNFVASNNDVITALKVKNAKKLYIIIAFVALGILSFIGGSAIRWERIDQFFEETTASQRAEVVRHGVETIGKVVK